MYVVRHLAKIEKNIFPLTLTSEIVRNCIMFYECFSFGTKHPSAACQQSGTVPLFHTVLRRNQSLLSSFGQFLYTLHGIPLGPGAEQALAFLMTSLTSWRDGSFMFSENLGGSTDDILSQSTRGCSLLGSEWTSLRYWTTSSSLLWRLPPLSFTRRALVNL